MVFTVQDESLRDREQSAGAGGGCGAADQMSAREGTTSPSGEMGEGSSLPPHPRHPLGLSICAGSTHHTVNCVLGLQKGKLDPPLWMLTNLIHHY